VAHRTTLVLEDIMKQKENMEKKFISLEVPVDLLRRLDIFCQENNIFNRSAYIRKLIEDKLNEEDKK
jgi:metal-responsive CopG/Arc/MetJ family transcriptional regulator